MKASVTAGDGSRCRKCVPREFSARWKREVTGDVISHFEYEDH
jgi:hypothetical protein